MVYGRVTIAFTAAFMLQNVFQSFLAAAEKPKLGLFVTVAAGLTNAVLDAVFIAGFRWGLAGAALATGLGQVVGGVLPLIYFLRTNGSLLQLEKKPSLEIKPILKACGNGSSEMMSNIATSLVSMLYNFQLLKYIGEDGVSAYGVLMYVQFIFIAISIGFSIGAAPIVSYHYGAQDHTELKNLLRKSVTLTLTVGVALTALAIAAAGPFAYVFVGFDESLFALTKHAFQLFAFSFLLAGFNIFCSGFFTALGNGAVSALISFCVCWCSRHPRLSFFRCFRYRWYLVGDHSFRGTGGYRFGGLSAGQAAALSLLKAAAENVSHETFVLFETDNYPKENLRDR